MPIELQEARMVFIKQHGVSGRDYYKSLYAAGLEQEAEWLRRGAAQKVDSIEDFLVQRAIKPRTIMELGCGPGAVIRECCNRGLASRYVGVDYSAEAVDYLRTASPQIEAIQADITASDVLMGRAVDVVVLSHVLEHLEEPEKFLIATLAKLQFSYLVVEVPLEDLFGARLKNLIKDRRINTSGHVQFFTRASFLALLRSHGLKILAQRTYVPINSLDTIRFLKAKEGFSLFRYFRMICGALLAAALYPLWSRLYYSHHAVLCVRDESGAASVER
jgi:hypothetical protein